MIEVVLVDVEVVEVAEEVVEVEVVEEVVEVVSCSAPHSCCAELSFSFDSFTLSATSASTVAVAGSGHGASRLSFPV